MIKHRFFQLLKKINIEILLIVVALFVALFVALLFYNNVIMENMTINIYTDGKGYKLNEVKDTSNVKPYTKSNTNNASSYPTELQEKKFNSAQSKSGENTRPVKKTEKTEAKKEADVSIEKRTSKYIDTFTAPITAEPP
jgi:hypothetical protein